VKKYELSNITEDQIHIIKDALEMYFRLGLGQINNVLDDFMLQQHDTFKDTRLDVLNNPLFKNALWTIKHEMFNLKTNNSYWGIYSDAIDNKNRVACEMYQCIRHCDAWDRFPEGGIMCMFDAPSSMSGKSMIDVKIVKDDNGSKSN
jgi:hypothetical protein